jgi:hypothetical protein
MRDDPAGHYGALDVNRAATHEAIVAAFRRKARLLHPDVPDTGDAAAFIRVRQAYEVLSDTTRRAAYDHTTPVPAVAGPQKRGGLRLADLPRPLWAALGGLLCVMAVAALIRLNWPSPPPQRAVVRSAAPAAPPIAPASNAPAVATADGLSTHYVLPAGDAVLWRYDLATDAYVPAGHVAAFSPMRVLRLVPQHGLAEIALADGGTGYVDAARLTPGDRATAQRANCAYNAGPSPGNGELLGRHGDGSARVEIINRGALPAVVRLRDPSGLAAATVFVLPDASAPVAGLPEVAYRPDFAVGNLWSRACNSFAAGMRAQRYAFSALPWRLSPLVIPPDLSAAPASGDISDEDFAHE